MVYIYSWIPAFKAFVEKLPAYRNRQDELVQVLCDIGVNVNDDEDIPGHKILMSEIDPFTFLFFLGKHRNEWNKVKVLRRLCEKWNIDVLVNDVCGIPSANAQKLWMFPWKHERTNDISLLWDFYDKALARTITDADFNGIRNIKSVEKQKISEGLFLVDPSRYLCLNGKVKPYLETFGINTEFETYRELENIYTNIRDKVPLAFHEISFKGYIHSTYGTRIPSYYRIGSTAGEGGESQLPDMLANNIVTIGWEELGNLNEIDPLTKRNIQTALQQNGYYPSDNRTASRKAGEILSFVSDIAPEDYVLVADGAKILSIGKVISNHYVFDVDLGFPHCRCVEWLKSDMDDFSIDEGLRTTVWKFYGESNINAIQIYLTDKKIPLPTPTITNNSSHMALNQILYGPPGTGKTFHSISYAVAIVEGKASDSVIEEANIDRQAVKKRFDDYINKGLVVFTTFHQSMSYEDFIEGIKPLPPEKDQDLKYDIADGIFKDLCNKAESNWFSSKQNNVANVAFETVFEEFQEQWESNKTMKIAMKTPGKEFTITGFTNKSIYFKKANGGERHTLSINTLKDIYYGKREAWENGVGIYYPGIFEKLKSITTATKVEETKVDNYVIIIDEINRGNVSQIFGELITLIEDDKRIGGQEALKITLPYSKDQFGVPPNLFIIGTMNTADRSVEALDTALRRRFSFVPKMPEENKLAITIDGIDLSKLLLTINTRLRVLKDNDHTIGHAWFWNVTNLPGLKAVYGNKVLQLLQEYFYNDYEKLGLVLGDTFFRKQKQVNSNILAPFSGGNGLASQYNQSWQFELKSAAELEMADFKSLETQINSSLADEDE